MGPACIFVGIDIKNCFEKKAGKKVKSKSYGILDLTLIAIWSQQTTYF